MASPAKREIRKKKTMSEELKNCPFCNGKARIEEEDYSVLIECVDCYFGIEYFSTKEEAITSWNKRAESEEVKQLKENIKDLEHQLDIQINLERGILTMDKEVLEFVKFCRNASANDIIQIHDRARDLIAKHKECCKYAECKDGREINFPTIPACTEKQDSSKELLKKFIKWDKDYPVGCNPMSGLYEFNSLILEAEKLVNTDECCEKSCKEENATLEPLIPKWRDYDNGHRLVLNLGQKAKWEFIINTKTLNVMSYIADDDIAISSEEVGTFDTLKDAKTKVNEYIGWLGECMMYFAENIKTERSGEE